VVVKVPFNQNFKENEIFDIKHTTAIISSFYHPNILGFMGICVNPLELVIEYAPNGNLKNYLASSVVISYSDKVRMCKDILQGLLYLSEVDEVKYRVHPNFKSSSISIII
jgi:serine/threonine protein kinase